jgi:hypothetical protein
MTPGDSADDTGSTDPSQQELQAHARRVWRKVQVFWVLVAIGFLVATGGLLIVGYRVAGGPGLLVAAVLVVACLAYGGRRLMEY